MYSFSDTRVFNNIINVIENKMFMIVNTVDILHLLTCHMTPVHKQSWFNIESSFLWFCGKVISICK